MKSVFFVFAAAAVIAFAGCTKNESAPSVPTTTVDVPAPTTTIAPVPTTEAPKMPEYCLQAGAKFNCGNPTWYGMPGCHPHDDTGDGTYWAKSFAEIEAMVKLHGSWVNVHFKDGTTKRVCGRENKNECIGMSPDCGEL